MANLSRERAGRVNEHQAIRSLTYRQLQARPGECIMERRGEGRVIKSHMFAPKLFIDPRNVVCSTPPKHSLSPCAAAAAAAAALLSR